MKIAHISDIHLGEFPGPIVDGMNGRMKDIVTCMDYASNKLIEEQPDIILIVGDLFHRAKSWGDEALKEISIASVWLRRLASIAPTVLLYGTGNHDNLNYFKNIRDMGIENLTIITEPDFFTINTQSGDIQIAAVPGMDKGFFRTLYPGMDFTDENKAISEALGNVIVGISADAEPNIPCVLMSHYTVTGCQLENGESVFLNSDVVLPTAALQASNYNLVCLGHIHRAQEVPNCGRPTFYSGPLNGITFNEEGQDKGFWIHECVGEFGVFSKFFKTPSREFLTFKWVQQHLDFYMKNGIPKGDIENIKDKIVRVIYSCDDETNKQFNRKELEKQLYAAGAFYVQEIRPSKILTTTDKQSMSENDSVMHNLKDYLKREEVPENDIKDILALAEPLINEIAASLPTGKLSGIFEPVTLEVKNYRSYKEESFDFSKVNFATVNGPNGIGKSSFFMDAISDCLYEEPREGELTGWINNGENVRSGSITFSFLMGADKWRVIRTRAKAGKTTLALQKWHKNKWEDHSENKKDDTQKKIVNLLGMDSMTFKSCALIMQDQYGLFLEADKTERMQVLGNILGLSVYDRLHELVKDKLRVHNREVEKLRSSIEILTEKLSMKNETEQQLKEYELKKSEISDKILQGEKKAQDLEENLKKFNILDVKIKALTDKIVALDNGINIKKDEISTLEFEVDEAQKIVDKEDIILAKIKEYEEAKESIAVLNVQKIEFEQAKIQLGEVKNNICELQKKSYINDVDIENLKVELKNKNELEKEVSNLTKLEEKLAGLDKMRTKKEESLQKAQKLKQKVLLLESEYEKKTDKIQEQIFNCKKKAKLINDSNCPVNNPSCNFLKDALEAKNKIPELEKQLKKFDYSEVEKADMDFQQAKMVYSHFDYNSKLHEETKKEFEVLRKKKEQLLSLQGKNELLENSMKQREDIDARIEELEIKRVELDLKIQNFKTGMELLSKLEKELPVLEHWYKGKDELPKAKQILESSIERIGILKTDIEKTNTNIKAIEADRDKLAVERAYLDGIEELLRDAKSNIASLQTGKSDIDFNIGAYKSKLDELKNYEVERKEKTTQLAKLARVVSQLNILVQAFSIDGIPFQIVRSVVDELSAKSNEILSQMTGGKMSIEFKMDKVLKNKKEVNALEIWINDYQRGTMPYLSRSGGQKVKAALSVAFALADLKANRAGIQLGMLFIDEAPFLDIEGVQAYCDALETIHERYSDMRLLAISHDPTFKGRFPQSIDVIDSGEQGSKIIFNE
ncbi:metallophosphoesterase [Clostridium kluyveri]|uniref:Nuclease SbcCD subunit C n=2 Tax=Clostridium kluyveri TaxID=1534 RepID=A5F9P1_CLOK5|nr:metallophosphoesterase [Clostridium kluyveri]ABQ23614.1 SbcCD related DNA repair protein [Clostridium kluyveri DSM 555]BAH08548.1 hypothetical protein CKR_P29 [Clostridium kluyveri NBRC 12016]